MQHAVANTSKKIWTFMDSVVNFTVIKDEEHQLTLKLENQDYVRVTDIVTLVYAKCTKIERLLL